MRKTLILPLALILLAVPCVAQEWDPNDPEIVSAALGMVTPIIAEGRCPDLEVDETLLKTAREPLSRGDASCKDCFLTGYNSVLDVIKNNGAPEYCTMMLNAFGTAGSPANLVKQKE